jgi:quercetin dioxygenase-like cupin family protein
LRLEASPRPEWSPLPYEGCVGVEGKVLVSEPTFFFSLLRFEQNGTIHEHPGDNDTYVACIEGEGWTSVAEERAPLKAGQLVVWPKDVPHRLWTEGTTMTTLMFEQTAAWEHE